MEKLDVLKKSIEDCIKNNSNLLLYEVTLYENRINRSYSFQIGCSLKTGNIWEKLHIFKITINDDNLLLTYNNESYFSKYSNIDDIKHNIESGIISILQYYNNYDQFSSRQ